MEDAAAITPASAPERRLGQRFRRVGWLGFWLQIVLGGVPVVLGTWFYLLSPNVNMPGGRLPLVSLLAMTVLLILVFTTILFFYYTRVGRRLEAGTSRWTRPRLKGLVRMGLAASGISVLFSSVVMIGEITHMLLTFLEFPQGGVPVIQTTVADSTWISALDVLSLLALSLSVSAEIVILGLGLWLMYWLTRAAPAVAPAADGARSATTSAMPELAA
jgi:hypothetical protein